MSGCLGLPLPGFVASLLALGAPLAEQLRGQQEPPSPPSAAAIAAAGERWLASDQTSRDLVEATVKAMLEAPPLGVEWLAGQLRVAGREPANPRAKGTHALASQVVLEFLRREQKRGIVYVGQYDPLLPLQPFAGDLLFGLLLETPTWYPFTFRVRLVPALRDLQRGPPSVARLDAVIAMAQDEREPQDLRRALAAMLWQWGKQEYGRAIVDALQAATTEGDAEDRVQTTLELADFWTQLRAYRNAANAHRAAQVLAADAGVTLRPIAWYSAACVHALLGDVDRGMVALERCARMLGSPDLDPSLRLERTLFEQDPEIDPLRRQPGFAALLQLAFGPTAAPADPAGAASDRRNGGGR